MASAAASTNYSASAAASTSFSSTYHDNSQPKFTEYRSRVMLGDLPSDFLRIQLTQPAAYGPDGYPMGGGQMGYAQHYHNPNFLGYLNLTIAEAKLIKSSGLLGLVKMDPYVTFRIGHVQHDTPTAAGGGKNPQWKASYRINLFRGMDRIHVEVFDQRNFTEDAFIGECEIVIPREVMEGEIRQNWYTLMGRNNNENQGDILIIMSFTAVRSNNQSSASNTNAATAAGVPDRTAASNGGGAYASASAAAATGSSSSPVHQTNEAMANNQHSPSAIPKPPPPPYSPDDVRTIEEMFPTVDRRMIIDLLDKHGGNRDLVVNHLLQNAV